MKTIFAVLASASVLAAPLAASAQDHRDWAGRGQANPAAAAPQAQVQQAPSQGGRGSVSGQPGNFDRRAGGPGQQNQPQVGGRGAAQAQPGGFDRRGGGNGQQNQPRAFNGGGGQGRDFAGRGPDNRSFDNRSFDNRGFDNRGPDNRGYDRRDDGRRDGYDRRGFAGGDYRGYGRGYNRSFRWGVGAFLPRTYWRYSVDPYAYGLDAAPYGYHWVLVEGAALLIDDYTGAIVQETWI